MGHIFLYGPVGAGKSTVGRVLARNLDLPFVDVDQVIEGEVGMTIFQLMEQKGEQACRDIESEVLKQLVNAKESVVALGGGALLRDENRLLVENHGSVIFLAADLKILHERLNADSNKRPLLAGNLTEKLTSLLTRRKEHYDSFSLRVAADQAPHELARQIQVVLGRFHLSAMGNYDALVQNAGIAQLGEMLRLRSLGNPLVVTDENVARLHAEKVMNSLREAGFAPKIITVPAGEAYKNLETIQQLWNGFLANGLDRRSTIIALGGGVIGDMAGFAASTYMRGMNWICVPTTLLSIVDASLGGKTGFDLPEGKNLIGSFYPPKLVLADPQALQTLPTGEFTSGLAEVVKHGVISDPALFDLCGRGLECIKDNLQTVVKRAMAVKIKIIEEDPYEKGFRAALNLGHTVGHAIELVSRFQLRHGEAVAIGIVTEAKLAESLAIAPKGLSDKISNVLSNLMLPVRIPAQLSREEILRAMRVDKKKSADTIRFALPVEIGKVELVDVSDLTSVLEYE